MSPDIVEELYFFLHSLLMGIAITFAYDLLIIFRNVIKHRHAFISLEDILFWAACAICLFAMLYKENNGVPRWFAIAGAAAGMVLYKISVSRLFIRLMTIALAAVLTLLYKITAFLCRPFVYLAGSFAKLSHKTENSCRRAGRFCKKQLTICRKMIKIILCKR